MEYDRERNLDPNRDPYRDPTMDPNYDPNADPSFGHSRDVEQDDEYDEDIQQDQPSMMDTLKGRQGAGKLTGNDDMEAEDRMQQEGGTADPGWGPGTRGGSTDLDQ
jgi:hypothetical protein